MVRINLEFSSENLHCSVHLSLPSVVLAEASWYGSMRAGWASGATSGVSDFASRWGVKGSNEVSDGLTAVYTFETGIDSNTANQAGRLSYVGLSGGFGNLTVGRIWSASDNHVGAVIDNSHWLGADEVTGRHGHVLSYAIDVGSVSLQADLVGNNGWGERSTAAAGISTSSHYIDSDGDEVQDDSEDTVFTDTPATAGVAEDKDIDSSQLGATLALGESGKIAFAHINYDTAEDVKDKQSVVVGEYTVGGMTMYLGFGQRSFKNDGSTARMANTPNRIPAIPANQPVVTERKDKTTYFGIRGGVGDTGVSYLLQVRNKKSSGKVDIWDAEAETPAADTVDLTDANGGGGVSKHSPWFFSLKRALGGGAHVVLEHSNPDQDGEDSDTALILRVDF